MVTATDAAAGGRLSFSDWKDNRAGAFGLLPSVHVRLFM